MVIDVDDDLGKKAGVRGPVIGEEENLKAAVQLATADPEDSDANTIFKAINLYRSLKKKGKEVKLVCLTGDKSMGARATLKISRQLDRVLKDYPAKSAIVVTDGSSDDTVMPIISSRLRIDAVENVYVKQAKELEKTYFVIIEKLKDPVYARILLGIPAILILGLSLVFLLNIKWQYLGFIVGLYLLIKGFGFDRNISELAKFIHIEGNPLASTLFAMFIVLMLVVGFIVSYEAYQRTGTIGLNNIEAFAYSMDALLNILGFIVVFVFAVKLVESYFKGDVLKGISVFSYLVMASAAFIVLKAGFRWVINLEPPYVSFDMFLLLSIIITTVSYVIMKYLSTLKSDFIRGMKLVDKDAFYADETYAGRVVAVDLKENVIKIRTPFDKILTEPLSKLQEVSKNRVIIE